MCVMCHDVQSCVMMCVMICQVVKNGWRLVHTDGEFKLKDSVTFVFQDRPPEEWARLG